MATFAGTTVLIMGSITIRRYDTTAGELFAVDDGGRCAGHATTFERALVIALACRRFSDDDGGSPPLAPSAPLAEVLTRH